MSGDNVESVKSAYSRCIVLREPQRFQAEITIDGRFVDMKIWLNYTELEEVRIVAAGVRLPSRIRLLTETEKEVLKLANKGLALTSASLDATGTARFPVLHCTVITARRSFVASLTPGINALRDRRNPAAGPVISATSMYAAGRAFLFIYCLKQSVLVIHE